MTYPIAALTYPIAAQKIRSWEKQGHWNSTKLAGLRTAVELSQLSANTLADATHCASLSTVGKLAFSQEQEETLQPESEVLDPVASPEAQQFCFQSMTAMWFLMFWERPASRKVLKVMARTSSLKATIPQPLFCLKQIWLDMARYATWCTRSSRGWVHKEFFTMYWVSKNSCGPKWHRLICGPDYTSLASWGWSRWNLSCQRWARNSIASDMEHHHLII